MFNKKYVQIPFSSSHHSQKRTDEDGSSASLRLVADNKDVIVNKVDDKIEVTHAVLGAVNVSQMREENKQNLMLLGGLESILISLGVDTSTGLTGKSY